MRQEVEFRLKRDVSRASPVARRRRSVDVRRSSGPGPMNETRHQSNDKASKLGSAIPQYIKSEVPPADHGLEVAIAAPSEVYAPMDPWPETF